MELELLTNALSLIVIEPSKCFVVFVFFFPHGGQRCVGGLEIKLVTVPLGAVVTGYDSA